MRFVVFGCGSIGKRHIGNLLALGHEVAAWNRGQERRQQVHERFGVPVFADLEQMFEAFPADAAIIATPQTFHLEHALMGARRNLHLFIEKPLSHSLEGLDELEAEAKARSLVTDVSCNMRYHFGPRAVKDALNSGVLGRPLAAMIWAGMYLPDWHPDEDYRDMYSAKLSMGGGAVMDFIHELDLALWLFGEPAEVVGMTTRSGWLEIETEDIVDAVLGHQAGFQVNMHLDYLQRPFQRGVRVIGDKGWIVWDRARENVELYTHDERRSEVWSYPEAYDHNDMYLEQMRAFVERIKLGGPDLKGFSEGWQALELARRIKLSSAERRFC